MNPRLSRHDWCPSAKDQLFSPEPQGEDPLPVHAKAVAACRATLTDAHRASLDAVVADETARQFVEVLKAVEVVDAPPSARPMRVVLMGRTMAGKSTLLAALTGGASDRIGVGAQRTSRDVFAASANDMPEVEIVDTPGVGAKDGAEDVALAMAEVPGADLILWVASNDSFQEETAQSLRALAYQGKPVVVALNCRAQLVDDLDREDFLEDADAVFEQHEGHFRTIRSHLSSHGVSPVAEVMLHAEAARQARTDASVGSALRQASRVDALLGVLKEEFRERRRARRVLREADEVRTQAETVGNAIVLVEQRVRETVHVGRGMREDQERRTARLVEACRQSLEDDVVRAIGKRQGWHQTVADFGPQVVDEWKKEQVGLVAELDKALKERFAQLERAINDECARAQREWASAIRSDLKVEGIHDFRGLWKRQAAGLAVGMGGAAAAAWLGFFVGGPPGAVVGAAASLLITPLRKKVQSVFTSKAKLLEANRELLRTQITEILGDLERQTIGVVAEAIDRVRHDLAAGFARQATSEAAALQVADALAAQALVIATAVSALDRETVGCLLLSDGRPRLAASVRRVTRLPGVCMAVQITEEALAEAWLFPPSSPELLSFGRAPSTGPPGAYAGPYVLGLTERVPKAICRRHQDTVVVTDAQVPDQVLAAWSATLSDHLGTQIGILNPSAKGSASA